jgi:hypothetical protein
MKEILALQKDFKDHLYQKSAQKIIAALPYSKQESLARLNIYRNNVFGNFNGVLQSIYEVVEKLVGSEYFAQICGAYNQKYFSKSGNLDNFGNDFAKFLESKKAHHKLAFLADLARLELCYHKSYFADISEKFPLEKFQKLSQKKFFDLKFQLHPSCFLLASKFAVFSIWKNNVEKKSSKKINAAQPEFVVIERVLNRVNIHKISQEEFLFLKNISKKTLFETYEKIVKITGAEFDIGALVNKFITNGIIINFKTKEPS